MTVINSETDNSSNKFEIIKMVVWVSNGGVGAYLEGVGVVGGVLEQSVHRVEHRVRQQIQPLTGHTPVIQTFLTAKLKI